jgi:hypothetical protein
MAPADAPPEAGPPQGAPLPELIARIMRMLQAGDDPAARAEAAREVDELRAAVAQAAPQRAPGALPGVDLALVADALRVFGDWLRAPTPASEAAAEQAIEDLQLRIGPLVGWDPGREDRARREQYRREARAALDEIFDKKP